MQCNAMLEWLRIGRELRHLAGGISVAASRRRASVVDHAIRQGNEATREPGPVCGIHMTCLTQLVLSDFDHFEAYPA